MVDGRSGFQTVAGASAAYGTGAGAGQALAAPSAPQWPPGRYRLGRRARGGGELRMRAQPDRARRHIDYESRRTGAEPDTAARGRCGRGARRQYLAPRVARPRTRNPDGARRTRCHPAHSERRAGRGRRRCRGSTLDALMRPRIYITQPVAPSAIERLRAVADVELNPDAIHIVTKDELLDAVRRHDILFCLLHDKVDGDVIAANPKLRAVASMKITPSDIDVEAATARRIPVTVIAPIVTEATADINFALLLAVARRVVEGDRLVRAGIFPGAQSSHLLGAGVFGKVIGLI